MKQLIITLIFTFVAFGASGESMNTQENSRYGQNPVYIFFEAYIQDVLGYLPKEKSDSISNMNIHTVFNTQSTDWRSSIKEVLHLSKTIDVAILDLWYSNREQFKTETGEYDPVWFSQVFTDEYMKEGSRVDVWTEDAFEAAKQRIKHAESEK